MWKLGARIFRGANGTKSALCKAAKTGLFMTNQFVRGFLVSVALLKFAYTSINYVCFVAWGEYISRVVASS